MTSIPASRSARSITLAPRSCPSSPGLAIRTRIGLSSIALFPRQRVYQPAKTRRYRRRATVGVGESRSGVYGSVRLPVPKEVNGRAGQGAELLTKASADVLEEPAVVLSAKPLLKNSSLVVPPMVAPKRLPASRPAPLSTGCPLYQSLAAPEIPRPKQ